jgi:hypothetical protein
MAGAFPANSTFAQNGRPVETPIPLATIEPKPVSTPEAAPTAEAADSDAKPAKTEAIVWTPASGTLAVGGDNQAKVRVTNTDVAWDTSTARFVRIVGGVAQPEQVAGATPVGDNKTVDLTANVGDPGTTPSNSTIVFKITQQGGGTPSESAIYTISRATKANLPIIHRDSGSSVIPTSIALTGVSACDASGSKKGGPLGAYVNYLATNPTNDMWFYTVNPNPGASIQVSLTNFSVSGQLQVYGEQSGCGFLTSLLGFGANPNPVVNINNLPAGNIYFRVASTGALPGAFTIRWAYPNNNSGGGSGSVVSGSGPCNAPLITQDTTYSTGLKQQYNFYAMDITAPAQIRITVSGVTVGSTQVQVRSPILTAAPAPNPCDPINATLRLDPFGTIPSSGGGTAFTVGIGDSGRYFIRVSTPSSGQAQNQAFTLKWNYVTGSDTSQPLFTTNPTQPFNPPYNGDITGNVVEGGVFNFYWSGMNAISGGFDGLALRIRPLELQGCPVGTFPPDPSRTVPDGFGNNFKGLSAVNKGQISIKFLKSGSYAVAFRATRGGTQIFFDEKPLRVGCGFATLFSKTPSFEINGADVVKAGPPIELMSGYRMSEQDTAVPEGIEPQP